VKRARLFKLRLVTLEPWLDVDTPEDLAELRRELAAAGPGERASCERTRAFLATLDAMLRASGKKFAPSDGVP
jgi:hypothetical protein